ncbi:MAG: hypothetical protein A2015_00730 [Spirochaetes bacterium GWF1_31_7]|nr:MAG: hypothetical protein A2Y30_12595 [Spirochaetes bacterium GWE1_32_154]OHD51648.1 MAG: hypothetical protein A2Y29_04395 [Spirochaetes bacterium GWE2_31_10]OHD51901.1 MAG: hypothetical protein A2015_00730 [Spirochaetes bacterium GWF1_31_7]OHD81011.1 MAG: hypothetical protein A2355_08670 [Spirochaetes bacterium RIFOXYB1_FULL_32_8]HBD93777.1 hypothetical protein [Spirochaetia bacterium]
MNKIAIPNMGNYSIAFAAIADAMGATPWISPTTPEIVKLGYEVSPDSLCLPFKIFIGHFIKAAEEGVEYAVMVNGNGPCRLTYYRQLLQKILDERGLKMHIFGLGDTGIKPPIIKHYDPPFFKFWRGALWALQKMFLIDEIEKLAWKTRPREIKKGETSTVTNQCLLELEAAKTGIEISILKSKIFERFTAININTDKKVLKVALVGEASVLRDKYLNHSMEELLGGLGVEVVNYFLLGVELKNIFFPHLSGKHSKKHMLEIAKPYLQTKVGGHALDSIAHSIICGEDSYDGVIHLCPSGCMPEISIRPILRKVSSDYDLPVLECSFDEHTSHVGLVTRLEAYIDMLYDRRKKNGKEHNT